MNLRLAAWIGAVALAGGLPAACAGDVGYYGPDAPYADVDYDGYYDGAYGPFNGGYWGPNDRFYYWNAAHGHYHADSGGHFRRAAAPGFSAIHGHAPAARGGGGGGRR